MPGHKQLAIGRSCAITNAAPPTNRAVPVMRGLTGSNIPVAFRPKPWTRLSSDRLLQDHP